MRDVNVVVFKFDELSKEAQENVIRRYRDRLADLLNNYLEDIMRMKLKDYTGNLDFALAYSLNYGQGDGISFTGSAESKEELFTLASLVYDNKIPKNILRLIKWDIIYKVDFVRSNYYYLHKYSVQINIIDNCNTNKDYCYINRAITEFEKAINKWYLQVCDTMERFGYTTEENIYSDDFIKSYIEANEWEFFIDGRDFLQETK